MLYTPLDWRIMGISYKTVKIEGFGTYEEKKSRFLGFSRHIESEEQMNAFLTEIRKKYYDASHHCYAFVSGKNGEIARSSDDREPSGTAGHPILSVIQKAGLTDTAVIVVRYFGGTLLGTGGLVRSYTKAAQEALRASLVIEKYEAEMLELVLDYSLYGTVQAYLASEKREPSASEFTDVVTIRLPVPSQEADRVAEKLTDLTQGRAKIERNEKHLWLEKTSEISL